ncbi:MAG: cytochrome c biogenesis protein CcsA [Kiritimatiellia bacterium]
MTRLWKMLTGRGAAVAALSVAAALSVVLACRGAEGALGVMRYYAAIGAVAALAAWGALACVRSWRRWPVLLLHAGFALVLGGWVLNECAGEEDGYLRLRAGQTGRVASGPTAEGFNLSVRSFTIDRWEDTGTVRQYTCRAEIEPDGAPREQVTISVNHPLVRCGWWVYQSSYEELENPHTGEPLYFTILQCVRDVGLPFVAVGGLLILLGALGYAFSVVAPRPASAVEIGGWGKAAWGLHALAFGGAVAMLAHRGLATGHPPMQNLYEFLMCAAALIPVLTFFARRERHALLVDALLMALVMIPVGFVMDGRVKHLMPALQSPFFVPHVGSYVLGYILLVRAALGTGRRLVGLGFFLLTVGLVLGAVWGKVCWGHWWQFDPKEMWSLATWFVYAVYFHARPRLSPRSESALLAVGAVMIVLTLTWINLSRIFTGMHSYA